MDAESDPPRVVTIVGTRPEAIKLLPVVQALASRGIDQQVIFTGQHRGLEPGYSALAALQSLELDLREQTAGEICEKVSDALRAEFLRQRPALVVVQGDTSSTLAGALAASDCGVPVAHVESGLRSFDLADPWPEEAYRIETDRIADLLFAPTATAAANLAAEGLRGAIHVTGNTGIDAMLSARTGLSAEISLPDSRGRRMILATCHRRENKGAGLARIALALRRLVLELPVQIAFPLHPNRHHRAAIEALLGGRAHIHLLPPLEHRAMVALAERCWLILTDSGGLQEEGPALGRPVLVLRDRTERVDAPESTCIVGTDPERIVEAVTTLMADPASYASMSRRSLAYGDGRAGERIAGLIGSFLG